MSVLRRHARAATIGALAAGALAVGAPAAASAATFTVNDNAAGAGPSGATCAAASFASIQAAVNAAANGDTILVCAGQYPEAVNVNKDLTLSGAKAGIDARDRSGAGGESVVLADDSDFDGNLDPNEGGIGLNAGGITLDGFSVVDSNNPATGSGIAMSPSFGNYLVTNNIVSDNTIGISANNADGSPSTISQNSISDNNVPGAAAGNGIYADSNVDDLTITDNEFSDQRNAGILLAGNGPAASNANVTISDNSFGGASGNPARNELRVLLLFTEDSTITGNEFRNMNNNAVHLAGANDSIDVSDNTITGSGFAGVRVSDFGVGPNSAISVIGNTLLGNDAGINVGSGGLAAAGVLTATGNRISGNTNGILNDSPGTVAAENNWFGCNEGPGSPGCDSVAGSNSAGVDAVPYLTLVARAPARIRDGRTRPVRARLRPSAPSPGYTCQFPDGTPIAFSTTGGTLSSTTADTQNCKATVSLTAVGSGQATVSATLDNETASDTVDFTANPN